jgi:hypothetical protein
MVASPTCIGLRSENGSRIESAHTLRSPKTALVQAQRFVHHYDARRRIFADCANERQRQTPVLAMSPGRALAAGKLGRVLCGIPLFAQPPNAAAPLSGFVAPVP